MLQEFSAPLFHRQRAGIAKDRASVCKDKTLRSALIYRQKGRKLRNSVIKAASNLSRPGQVINIQHRDEKDLKKEIDTHQNICYTI